MGIFETAPVTFILLVANVLISLFGFSNREFLSSNLLTTQGVLKQGQVHRTVTSGFIHANQMHLFVNMLTLYFFGPYLEARLGSSGFAFVYGVSLLAGSGWALVENLKNMQYAALGASGAVSGIVIGYCLFEPFSLLYLFFFIPIPAALFAVLYIAFSAAMSGREGKRIAHEAHLGGAVGGFVATLLIRPEAWGEFIGALSGLFS
ncbi:MAG: rhomboid family intramembrane serine protease [Hyphomonadaceae bacterium]